MFLKSTEAINILVKFLRNIFYISRLRIVLARSYGNLMLRLKNIQRILSLNLLFLYFPFLY